jgi:outer membrane beta-barrel protein
LASSPFARLARSVLLARGTARFSALLARGTARFDPLTTLILAGSNTWLLCSVWAGSAQAQCIDEAIRDELNARRQYRGVQERLFQKERRHEISALGGVYAADLTSSSYLVGGAYTYHLTEDFGLEASFGYTRSRSELVTIIEDRLATDLVRDDVPVFLYQGHLLWTLAYGKLRWFGSRISRFDFNLALGGGITDNRSARGLTGSAGVGLKFYPTSYLAVRIDLRDQLLSQELMGESRLVNNLCATLGVSMFLPFGF